MYLFLKKIAVNLNAQISSPSEYTKSNSEEKQLIAHSSQNHISFRYKHTRMHEKKFIKASFYGTSPKTH